MGVQYAVTEFNKSAAGVEGVGQHGGPACRQPVASTTADRLPVFAVRLMVDELGRQLCVGVAAACGSKQVAAGSAAGTDSASSHAATPVKCMVVCKHMRFGCPHAIASKHAVSTCTNAPAPPAAACRVQMASNDVGSLLVYDKDKAGPGGDIPQTVDACVGIITERGGWGLGEGGNTGHTGSWGCG